MGNKFTYKLPVPINLLRCILRLMPQYNLSLGVLLFIFSLCYQVILCFIMYMLQINGCSLILYARCYRYSRLLYNICASDRNKCNFILYSQNLFVRETHRNEFLPAFIGIFLKVEIRLYYN